MAGESKAQQPFRQVFTVTVDDERHLRNVTANHIRRRDELVARVFAYMGHLKQLPAAQRLGDRPHFRCEKATVQERPSLGRFAMQAAHCLPGQLSIAGILPWDLFPPERAGAAGDLRGCFEAVDNLPVSFNFAGRDDRSDSESAPAEEDGENEPEEIVSYGMTVEEHILQEEFAEVFREPCEQLFHDDRLLHDVFYAWIGRSDQVYGDAVAFKLDRMLQERDDGNADTFERRQLDSAILAAYRVESGQRRARADSIVQRASHEVKLRWAR